MKASMEGVRSIGMTARSRGESKDQSLRESRHPLLDDSAEAPHGPSRRTHDQGEQPLIRSRATRPGRIGSRFASFGAVLTAILPAGAFAQTPAAPPTGPGGSPMWLGNLFLIVSFMLIFYFLLLRPQQKRQKQAQKMLESLKKGDRVITTGGIHGTILAVKDDVVTIKIDDNVKVDVSKSAVGSVVTEGK
jgi:preprotein translocase subunit YajC